MISDPEYELCTWCMTTPRNEISCDTPLSDQRVWKKTAHILTHIHVCVVRMPWGQRLGVTFEVLDGRREQELFNPVRTALNAVGKPVLNFYCEQTG